MKNLLAISVVKALTLGTSLCGIVCAQVAFAGAADYVYTPAVEYGEREIDIKYGSASSLAGNSSTVASIGLGFGAKEYWFTEIYLKQQRSGNTGVTLAEWENKFQLTETGKYPLDLGFVFETEAPINGDAPWELRLGPLLQTDFGKLQMNGNLLFERAFGKPDENGVPYSTNLAYQWQAKYRWQRTFEFGVQGLGDVGKWNEWSKNPEQNHRVGPAVFGKFALANRQAIKYNAAWLFGTSKAAPNHTFRMQMEYEF